MAVKRNADQQRVYSLPYTHEELIALLEKIADAHVLNEEEYEALKNLLGLDLADIQDDLNALNMNDQIMNASMEKLITDNEMIREEVDGKADKFVVDDLAANMNKKVDKEDGKGLSANDYTDEEKEAVMTLIENGGGDSFITNETFITKRDQDKCEKPLLIVKASEFNNPLTQISAADPKIEVAVQMGIYSIGDIIDIRKGRATEVPFRVEQDEFLEALEEKDFFKGGLVDGDQLSEVQQVISEQLELKANKSDLDALARKDEVASLEEVQELIEAKHNAGAEKLLLTAADGGLWNVIVRDNGQLIAEKVALNAAAYKMRNK
jgi:hypothetical protein